MNRLLLRQRRVLVIEPTAVYADASPALGTAWIINAGYGWHDEGGPLSCLWAYDDGLGGGFRNLCAAAALATTTYRHLYADIPNGNWPFILRYGQTIRWNCAAKTAGKNAVIELLVDEALGETAYVG
jgi:hypothetical protein